MISSKHIATRNYMKRNNNIQTVISYYITALIFFPQ
jgi:hypothetical protein